MIDNHEVRQSIVHFVHRFLIETGRWNKIDNNLKKKVQCVIVITLGMNFIMF